MSYHFGFAMLVIAVLTYTQPVAAVFSGLATTTRYYDGRHGACGCGPQDVDEMYGWQLGPLRRDDSCDYCDVDNSQRDIENHGTDYHLSLYIRDVADRGPPDEEFEDIDLSDEDDYDWVDEEEPDDYSWVDIEEEDYGGYSWREYDEDDMDGVGSYDWGDIKEDDYNDNGRDYDDEDDEDDAYGSRYDSEPDTDWDSDSDWDSESDSDPHLGRDWDEEDDEDDEEEEEEEAEQDRRRLRDWNPATSHARLEASNSGGDSEDEGEAPSYDFEAEHERIYTAAASPSIFGNRDLYCGNGCGRCFRLTSLGNSPCNGEWCGRGGARGKSIVVMVTNLCPAEGNEEWCAGPGEKNEYGYKHHFDIMAQESVFGDNPVVRFKEIRCPGVAQKRYRECLCHF